MDTRPAPVDLPFLPPPDIVLDVPVPPSVNLTRRHDPRGWQILEKWKLAADRLLMARGQIRQARKLGAPLDRFEVVIRFAEGRCDLDNCVKSAIDYCRRIELIRNDAPKNMRRITVEWGDAPEGCQIILRRMVE